MHVFSATLFFFHTDFCLGGSTFSWLCLSATLFFSFFFFWWWVRYRDGEIMLRGFQSNASARCCANTQMLGYQTGTTNDRRVLGKGSNSYKHV